MLARFWAPQTTIIDLRLIEGVQRRATRFILNCSHKVSERPSYKNRLNLLRLLPLSYWHEYRDLCFFFKCHHGLYNLDISSFTRFASGRTRSASNLNLLNNSSRTSLFRDSFFNRISNLWNSLPPNLRSTDSFFIFKKSLYNFYLAKFNTYFDTTRIQTWKSVCPHCRSINKPNCC